MKVQGTNKKKCKIKTFISLKIHFFHIFMYWMCYSSINEEQLYCDTGINAKLRKLKKKFKKQTPLYITKIKTLHLFMY